jgi:hypothetical protein
MKSFRELWSKRQTTYGDNPRRVWVVCPGCNGSGVIDRNARWLNDKDGHIVPHDRVPDIVPCAVCGGGFFDEGRPVKGSGQVLKYVGPVPAWYHRLSYSGSFFSFKLKLFRNHWPPGHYDSKNEKFLKVRMGRLTFKFTFWPRFEFDSFYKQ